MTLPPTVQEALARIAKLLIHGIVDKDVHADELFTAVEPEAALAVASILTDIVNEVVDSTRIRLPNDHPFSVSYDGAKPPVATSETVSLSEAPPATEYDASEPIATITRVEAEPPPSGPSSLTPG